MEVRRVRVRERSFGGDHEQLSIWYDAKVFYANEKVKNLRFTGDATRFTEIKDILSILEKTGSVVFEMNGRTITVYGKE